MEEWQENHIKQNLPKLIRATTFNTLVKAEFIAQNVLDKAEIDKLDASQTQNGQVDATYHYYYLLLGRTNAYKVLTKALLENHQTGAARILIDGVPNHISDKPLTYLGIPIKLDGFEDTEIEIQGKKSTLHKFLPTVDPDKLQQLFQETVSELEIWDTFLIKQKTFVLAINTVPTKPPYYIPRFLSNRIKIDEAILKADCQDVFVFKKTIERYKLSQIAKPHFTDTSTSQLTNISCRFIYLDDDEDWTELKKFEKAPIHLINYESEGNQFILEDSSAPSDILRKLGCREERVYMSEEEFVQQQLTEDCTPSSVCIWDTPGMGKTFLLANIARLIADNCAGRIVVFIQLTSFANDFCTDSSKTTSNAETSLISVLSYSCRPRHLTLLLTLVKAEQIRLEIFFDGFDEIPADKVEWLKQVFRSIIMNFPNVRIYITSRPHMRQELEKSLGVVAHDILPFNKQTQVKFLVQFWQKSKPDLDLQSLESYATNCLEAVNESLTTDEKEIAGIPLLCQLIAEVYSDRVAFHSIKRRKFSDFKLQISGIYRKFSVKKIELVAKDKKEFDRIKMVHTWHALKLLFPTNGLHEDKQFETVNEFLTSPEILGVGILQKDPNGALEFIHRTFAEYLVAEYFFENLMEMQKTDKIKCDTMSILKMLLNCQNTEQKYTIYQSYNLLHPVIVSFFNSALLRDQFSEELKMQAVLFVSSISDKNFVDILCACCQHNLFNIFCLLTQSLTKWDKTRIVECFTIETSHELLGVCVRKSTTQLFHKCILLLAEKLKLDLKLVNMFKKYNTLLQLAVWCANYETVEYFVDSISLKNQSLLNKCVEKSYWKDDIEKRGNILHLLLNKDPTLIHEAWDVLLACQIDVRLFKILVKFGAHLTAADSPNENCAMVAARYMAPTDFHKLVEFLLADCKADYLFLDIEKWKNPLPHIISRATLLPETLEILFNISGMDINMKDEDGENLLFYAAIGNKADNLQQLVERGLDYNARCRKILYFHDNLSYYEHLH